MKLYFHPASTCSRTVMLFAAESGLEPEPVIVDLMAGAHLQEPFRTLNPKRLIPVLEDDGFVLTESAAILLYLAEKVDSPAWPKAPRSRARVNEVMHYLNSDFYRDWGYNLIYPQVFSHHFRKPPESNEVVVRWGLEKSKQGLGYIDQHLLGAGQHYLAGEDITLADYLGAGILSAGELIRADLSPYPNVTRWYGRMQSLRSWPKVTDALHGFAKMLKDKPFINDLR